MRMLLHVCCAPCSTHAIEELRKENEVFLFFSNSNIFPREEFERRKAEFERIAKIYGLDFFVDDYDHASWLDFVKGFEKEPEGGKRCARCFLYNLGRARDYALKNGFQSFTTTLTISPYKSNDMIFSVGEALGGFLPVDFKSGFSRSIGISKRHGLYRQRYCGCEFGMRSMASPKE